VPRTSIANTRSGMRVDRPTRTSGMSPLPHYPSSHNGSWPPSAVSSAHCTPGGRDESGAAHEKLMTTRPGDIGVTAH
jgi:hypothetical protein